MPFADFDGSGCTDARLKDIVMDYPHPAAMVWHAVTDPELVARWTLAARGADLSGSPRSWEASSNSSLSRSRLARRRRLRGPRSGCPPSPALLVARRGKWQAHDGQLSDRAASQRHPIHVRAHWLHWSRWLLHGQAPRRCSEEDAQRRPSGRT